MSDREKVIQGFYPIMRAALEFLKSQEAKQEAKPVKVIETEFGYKHYFCPNCGKWFDYKDVERKYCHRCGQEVKWE